MPQPSQAELRQLVEAAQDEEDDEGGKARKRLRKLAEQWRGFPGQRHRGDLPRDVNVR